jgi:hypothetical protein
MYYFYGKILVYIKKNINLWISKIKPLIIFKQYRLAHEI